MSIVVYKISSTVDNRIYIGSTINHRKRWKEHKNGLLNNIHANIHLQRFVNKYSINRLIFEILEICTKEELLIREQYYLNLYTNLFNIATCAKAPMMNRHHSNNSIQKISVANIGIKNSMFGKTHTDEAKELMRIAQTGRTKTKYERLLRLTKLNTRKELKIIKENTIINCFSYAHAATIIKVKQQSISSAIKRNTLMSKGWILIPVIKNIYTIDIVLDNINNFSDELIPNDIMVNITKIL